jgi:hypothetical protein
VAERQGLEQAAHAVRLGQALGCFDQSGGALRRLTARKPAGALEQAEPGEKRPLGDGTVDGGAGGARGGGEGGKIHMSGEVGGAGRRERVGGSAVGDGLEGVSLGAAFRAVVEEQRGAGVGGAAGGEGGDEGVRGFAEFVDLR